MASNDSGRPPPIVEGYRPTPSSTPQTDGDGGGDAFSKRDCFSRAVLRRAARLLVLPDDDLIPNGLVKDDVVVAVVVVVGVEVDVVDLAIQLKL